MLHQKAPGELKEVQPNGNDRSNGTPVDRFSSESLGSAETQPITAPHGSDFEKI